MYACVGELLSYSVGLTQLDHALISHCSLSAADIDECSEDPSLCRGGRCINTPGSFRCGCGPGYREVGGTCLDIDECAENPAFCQPSGAHTGALWRADGDIV